MATPDGGVGGSEPGHRLQRFDHQLFGRVARPVGRHQRHRIADAVDEAGQHHPA